MNKNNLDVEQVRMYSALLSAIAVQRRFEGARLGTGGVSGQGFYYDFDLPRALSEDDLPGIEEDMRRMAAAEERFSVRQLPRGEAVRLFEERGEHKKAEWLRELPGEEEVAVFERGGFADVVPVLLAGGLPCGVPEFKLLSAAGAYWRGDSNQDVLQRIYGVAFPSRQELDVYMAQYEEARKRDHRKLGKQLELFLFADEAPGMPFYLPKGTVVRNELEGLSREFLRKYGYQEVRTPIMMNRQLWEQSGHWDHFRDNMYFSELDHHHFALKPMNCPGHMLIYKSKPHSYRELPLRLAEFGQVHRHEFSGALNGLLRVRTFCQDDAHIFVRPDQIEAEIGQAIRLVKEIYGIFGFEYSLELSTRPEQSMGSDEQWEAAEGALLHVLEASGLPYQLNPGDGAFYGPKIDFHIRDALHRSHQCATIQLDFQMPVKFGLAYVDENNEKQTPIVIHRAVYGSIDRFLGILIEHYAGAFPLWLAPVQAVVLPVADSHAEYAARVCGMLQNAGIRAEADVRNEKLGYRIREGQLQKIPYLLVVGDKEQEERSVHVRRRGSEERQQYGLEPLLSMLQEKIRSREA